MTTTAPERTVPERRLLGGLELRDVETTETRSMMRGRAVPYGEWANIGFFLESFKPGSLAKSIKEAARDLPLNLFHENRWWPIGAADEWIDGDRELEGVWRLDDSDIAQNAARLADQGMLTGLSIEFQPIRSEWDFAEVWDPSIGPEGMDRVTRLEARLGAVGLVQTPAYVSAGVTVVRSADARRRPEGPRVTPVLDELKRVTEQLRRG